MEDDCELPPSLLEDEQNLKCYFCPVKSNDRDTLTFHLVHTHWKKVKKRLAEAAEKSDGEGEEGVVVSVNPEFAEEKKKVFPGGKSKRKRPKSPGGGQNPEKSPASSSGAKNPRVTGDEETENSEFVVETEEEKSRNLEKSDENEGNENYVDETDSAEENVDDDSEKPKLRLKSMDAIIDSPMVDDEDELDDEVTKQFHDGAIPNSNDYPYDDDVIDPSQMFIAEHQLGDDDDSIAADQEDINELTCHHCGLVSETIDERTEHEKVHDSLTLLERRIELENRVKRPERRRFHQCRICDKEHRNRAELMLHLRADHPGEEGPPLALRSAPTAFADRSKPTVATNAKQVPIKVVTTAFGRKILVRAVDAPAGAPNASNVKVMMMPKSQLNSLQQQGKQIFQTTASGQPRPIAPKPAGAANVKVHTYAATGTPDMVLTNVDQSKLEVKTVAKIKSEPMMTPRITSVSTSSSAYFGHDPSKLRKDDLPCTPSGRRARTNFSWDQIQVLSEYFRKSNYVQREDVEVLMKRTGLLERNIRVWFQNRRNQYDRAYEGKLAQHRQ